MGLLEDARNIQRKDPAARSVLEVILLYPGFHILVYHRIAHWLFEHKHFFLARWVSQRGRHKTGIEIHPGAKIGKCLFIDHGMGIVFGETAEIGDNCTIYHGVTLGGTGKDTGKRHPTLGNNVLIGAGTKVLGPVYIGDNARIGAGSVVLKNLPANCTAVGVPAEVVRINNKAINPADDLDQQDLPDNQDTLFTGPLPEKERQPGGFIGPKQFAPRINGRQYYKNCYICGDIDFIFGSATAYFEHCTLESLLRTKASAQSDLVSTTSTLHDSGSDTSALCHSNSDMVQKNYTLPPIQGYVTAASTPEGQEYGYIFSDCRFISKDCPAGSVYLGRPWRDYAKTILISCELGAHIHPAGFHDWNRENTHDTVYYAEYASFPATSDYRPLSDRADFVQNLNEQQAGYFAKELVLGDWAPDKL